MQTVGSRFSESELECTFRLQVCYMVREFGAEGHKRAENVTPVNAQVAIELAIVLGSRWSHHSKPFYF